MKLPLAYYPDPVLLKKAERVNHIDDALRLLVHDMVETMHASRGIGLAAPQVHRSIALFVSCVPIQGEDGKWIRGTNKVFINPQVLETSPEKKIEEEGCLSLPNLFIPVERAVRIRIQATDLMGQTFEETMEGLFAANFLHEYDHLNGVLILDYQTKQDPPEF